MKAQDARSQKGQNTLVSSVTAMTKAADLALQKYGQARDLITLLTDAIAMALQCNHEVNNSRRVAMQKEMHKDYAALCNPSTVEPTSEFLFGDLSNDSQRTFLRQTSWPKRFANNIMQVYVVTRTWGGRAMVRARETERFTHIQRGKTSDFLAGKRPFLQTEKEKVNAIKRAWGMWGSL